MNKVINVTDSRSRTTLFYILLGLVGIIFIGRLFQLQIIKNSEYSAQAAVAQKRSYEIPADRGKIYAYDGSEITPLVLNEVLPTIFADQRFIEDPEETAQKLQSILGGKTSMIMEKLEGEAAYSVVKTKVAKPLADEVKKLELAGIGTTDVSYRVYPEGSLASQLLGFVNNDGHGQYGLEESINQQLAGEDGVLEAVTDINNVPLTTNSDNIIKQSQDGQDVVLTIDTNIQRYVEEALVAAVNRTGGKSGSAIVMDPSSGAVRAVANFPTYDPAEFSSVEDFSKFLNPAITESYETGSGMKVFTMSTGLNEGVVTKDSTYYDGGSVQVDDRLIENADGGYGTIPMSTVIQNSVNTGVVHVLGQLGGGSINQQSKDTLHRYFTEKFGFGTQTGIAQANEAGGTVIGPYDVEGNNVRYANMTFGQGVTVTMLQMASALSAIINGGDYYQPHLIAGTQNQFDEFDANDPQIKRQNIISSSVSQDIVDMMQLVVENGGGKSAKRDGYMIGGKTGTSQIIDEATGLYSEFRENGSFIGFGASTEADYVIMTRINEPTIGGYAGSVAAAPLFADISNFLIDYYQIPPNN